MSALPVVTVSSWGVAVTESPNGLPVTEAADKVGLAVTKVASGGVLVTYGDGSVEPEPPDPGTEPEPGLEGQPPMSGNDPNYFSDVTSSGPITLAKGQNVASRKFNDKTGNPALTMLGNNNVTNCSIYCREGPRVAGGGNFNLTGVWIEVYGTGDDHADGIQAYSPGSRGTIFLKDTTIRAYKAGDPAQPSGNVGAVGMFVADNWTGTCKMENVLFWGGMYGCRICTDVGGTTTLDFKDVYFVGPFAYDGCFMQVVNNKKFSVARWENVCNATIDNAGRIVPGSAIPRPS
jgi:hypothetical protein